MGTASEVKSKEVKPSARSLRSFDTDLLSINGVMLWGEVNQVTEVVDYDDFLDKYQGLMLNYETPVQVRQFFLGDGRKVLANRVVHIDAAGVPVSAAKAANTYQTAATSPSKATVLGTNAAPFALVNGDTLIGNVEGVGNQTATITAVAALLECANAENYALTNGWDLTLKIDGGAVQTIDFLTAEFVAIGAATAEEVAAVINAKIVGASATVTSAGTKVTITSDKLGTGSHVEITGGTANAAFGFITAIQNGSGNVADVSSVTIAELKIIIEAAWTNGSGVVVTDASGYVQIETVLAGVAGTILVDASSTADDELGLDNATHTGASGAAANTMKVWGKYYGGTIGNAITFDVTAASSAVAEQFDIVVYLNGVQVDTHANLTMDTTSVDYVATRLSHAATESMLIDVTDLSAVGTPTERRPANSAGNLLAGGDDGLALLDDADFIGYAASNTGWYAFSLTEEGDIYVCPDRATTAVYNALSTFLETVKNRTAIGIPDPTLGLDEDAAIIAANALTPSEQLTAMPWPAIKIANPDKTVYGNDKTIIIKPSCSIAARMAANTQENLTHVATQPGNELFGRFINVTDVESTAVKSIVTRRKVTPHNINPIFAGKDTQGTYGVWLNDVQALDRTGNFISIGEIRLMALIRKDVIRYMESQRTTPNTERNRSADAKIIKTYMTNWVRRNALINSNVEDCFYVNTDPKGVGINNALVQEREEYKVLLAVATARSRRFIEVMFTRDQRAVEAALAAQLVA